MKINLANQEDLILQGSNIQNVGNIEMPIVSTILENEEIISASLNDLNNKIEDHDENSDIHVTLLDKARWDEKQDQLTIDPEPTENSDNPVSSGGVKTELINERRIFSTYNDAIGYVQLPTSGAVAGMRLSVTSDPDSTKNGIYFVKSVGINGEMELLGTAQDIIISSVSIASGTTSISASNNNYYVVQGTVSTLSITLPDSTGYAITQTPGRFMYVGLYLTTDSSTPNIGYQTTDGTSVMAFSNYEINPSSIYEISCIFNGSVWVVGCSSISTTPLYTPPVNP